jgi:polar amino acid transport system permease protein
MLPLAMKAIAPPLGNQIISMTLSSCVISQISAEDLTFRAMMLENRTFRSFEIYIVTILIYFLLAEFLYIVIGYINRKVFGIAAKQKLPTMI